jgi:small subunit ribosomal protein S15
MHTGRKGRSGSKRPLLDKNPEWVQQSPEEIKNMVVKLAGEGMTMAKLGLVLRDQYGVPNVKLATGLSVKEILDEAGVKSDLPEDLANLMRRAVEISRHVAQNKKDYHNKRGMQLVESKIRRLTKYYKREGVIPETWNYSLSTAALQVE